MVKHLNKAPSQAAAEPSSSAIAIIEPRDDGVHVEVPPRSFLRGTQGLGYLSAFWLIFTAVMTVLMFPAIDLMVSAFLLLFWLVGLGLLVGSLAWSRRCLVADVIRTGDDGAIMLIFRKGLLASEQHEFNRTQVESIDLRRTSVEINDRPLIALEVRTHEGKTVRLLSSTRREDLLPVREALRNALGC